MERISKIRKRTGEIAEFEQKRITDAVYKAMYASGMVNRKLAEKISSKVVLVLNKEFKRRIPDIEDIQDIVVRVLRKQGLKKIAKEYEKYRRKKQEIRRIFGIKEKLTANAITVLRKRYLLKDRKGRIIETPEQMFRRVAKAVAGKDKKLEEKFYKAMSSLEFLPNSPTLFNAGTRIGALSACYVLPIEDSLKSIFEAVKNTALIEQTGGGIGFDFSKLRPKGDLVQSTKGVASGPCSFMRVFDIVTDVIKAGGRRRGAMMGILRADHPDILEFIKIKGKGGLSNFNLSVAVTDKFMKAVKENKDFSLVNPRNKKAVKKIKARKIWDLIAEHAWKTGDPGLIFIDEINRKNPIPKLKITATNPCSEQPLLDYESCNLGSINLARMVIKKKNKYEINWKKLKQTIHTAVRFLDNVIDVNRFPLKKIEKITKRNRKIGLGIMGFAELLILLDIPYDSEKAIKTAEKLMKFIQAEARKASVNLGKEKGSFPNFRKSIYYKKYKAMRNAALTTIAPTGSLSIISSCSSGIEPIFALSFMRNVLGDTKLFEVNPIFERIAKQNGFYSTELLAKIAKTGSLQKLKIRKNIKRIFKTALDIKPEWHVKIQAAFQKYTDNAVSKTINMPKTVSVNDVKKAFLLAYKLKCKGITAYRYGSKEKQVLYIGVKHVTAMPEYAGGCPKIVCNV